MYNLDYNTLINLIINICFYFMVSSLGAFIKDMYNSITKKDEVIRVKRILVGSVFSTFVLLAIEDLILSKQSINIVIFISFILGGVGFELFGKWVTVDTVERIIKGKFR